MVYVDGNESAFCAQRCGNHTTLLNWIRLFVHQTSSTICGTTRTERDVLSSIPLCTRCVPDRMDSMMTVLAEEPRHLAPLIVSETMLYGRNEQVENGGNALSGCIAHPQSFGYSLSRVAWPALKTVGAVVTRGCRWRREWRPEAFRSRRRVISWVAILSRRHNSC